MENRPRVEPPPIPQEARRGQSPENKETTDKLARDRGILRAVMEMRGLQPETALHLLSAYSPDKADDATTKKAISEIVQGYGLPPEELTESDTRKISLMYLGLEKGRNEKVDENAVEVIDAMLKDTMMLAATKRMDALEKSMLTSSSIEELTGRVNDVMSSMATLARKFSPRDEKNAEIWAGLEKRFTLLRTLKREHEGTAVDTAFETVFEKHRGFIEDDLLEHALVELAKQGKTESVEHAMREVYGMTEDDYKKRKQENRVAAVQKLQEMTGQPFSVTTLETLHETYNKGIVPKKYSTMRGPGDDMGAAFGAAARVGLLPDDVKPEMEIVVQLANDLEQSGKEGLGSFRYGIEAAKLHNDMLDIHPFADRNGSTSLMFLELMMAKKGDYEPKAERKGGFYDQVRAIVGNNPVAVAVVGYEMAKMHYQPGHFEGRTFDEKKKERYEMLMSIVKRYRENKKKGS